MNTELYKSTFESVHASDELKGKVENMANNKKRIWNSTLKKVGTVAAVAAIVFATGNVATYAATGNNLIDAISIKMNGDSISPSDKNNGDKFEKKTDEKGRTYYESSYDKGDSSFDIKLYEDSMDSEDNWQFSVTEDGDGLEVEIDNNKK